VIYSLFVISTTLGLVGFMLATWTRRAAVMVRFDSCAICKYPLSRANAICSECGSEEIGRKTVVLRRTRLRYVVAGACIALSLISAVLGAYVSYRWLPYASPRVLRLAVSLGDSSEQLNGELLNRVEHLVLAGKPIDLEEWEEWIANGMTSSATDRRKVLALSMLNSMPELSVRLSDRIMALFDSANGSVTRRAIIAMDVMFDAYPEKVMPNNDSVVQQIRASLSHPDPVTRYSAVLFAKRNIRTLPMLRAMIDTMASNDPDRGVRQGASGTY